MLVNYIKVFQQADLASLQGTASDSNNATGIGGAVGGVVDGHAGDGFADPVDPLTSDGLRALSESRSFCSRAILVLGAAVAAVLLRGWMG